MAAGKRIRVIPVLSCMGMRMVKTVRFKNPNYLGDPLNAVKILNEKRVDEIMVLDITASREKRAPNYALIEAMAAEAFMPFGYGGGIRTFSQAASVFALGAEKVLLNSALLSHPELIGEIASVYGSQSVVVSLDIKNTLFGKQKAAFFSAGKTISTPPRAFLEDCIARGAGECILQSVSRDGTFEGFDLRLLQAFRDIPIPLVALGGCKSLEDMSEALAAGADALAAGSFFAYRNNDTRSILINYPSGELLKKQFQ